MCYWTLSTQLTLERLHQIEKQAKLNNDSHGFICLDCDVLEVSLNFDTAYQNLLIAHFYHSVISHNRITSMGVTNITNAQPIKTHLGNTLIHNGTCNLKKVIDLIDRVNTTLRGADISDTVSMAILLDNAKTEEEQKLLMSEFNQNDFIGNLAYYRKGSNKILLDLDNGSYNETLSYVETLGRDKIKGYFDIEKKEFNVTVEENETYHWWEKYNMDYYNNNNNNNSCDVPDQKNKVCTFDKEKQFCSNDNTCILHGCSSDYCSCPAICNFDDVKENCNFICVVHDCSKNKCFCPHPLIYLPDEEEPEKDYESIHYKELFY